MRDKMRVLLAAGVVLGGLTMGLVVACGGEDNAEPTATSAAATTQPTESGATEPAATSGMPAEGASNQLEIAASGLAFDKDELTATAGEPITVTFDNQDDGVPHTFSLYRDDAHTDLVAKTDRITGPDTVDLAVPALDAGDYYYRCDIHTTQMQGELKVQ